MSTFSYRDQSYAYRPDIDGLRAFAVLSVLFFHAFPKTLKGGFIGVDVFFVISGYLICGIILRDLQVGAFSFANFYARRIRRIFPSLIVVLAAVLAAGWFVLLPDTYEALGKHVCGGTLFVSNFVLWNEAGYFDVAAKAKPLLHLWSLGIEEQYYIFFPVFLWYCAKKKIQAGFAIAVLCFLSFFDNIYLHRISPIIDFYSPLSRFWELLLGAGLAAILRYDSAQVTYLKLDALCSGFVYVAPQKNDGHSLSLIFAIIGSVLLGLALLLARETNSYPGWMALLPTMGAAFLIVAGPLNPISNYFLSNRLSVFIGKISYPLYLWHWVLISFAFIIWGDLGSETRFLRVGLVAASFVLATLTFWAVEKPVRFGARARSIKVLVLIGCMISICWFGFYVQFTDGLPERQAVKKFVEDAEENQWYERSDFSAGYQYAEDAPKGILPLGWVDDTRCMWVYCAFRNAHGAETIAIFGDSLARGAYLGIADVNERAGINTFYIGGWSRGVLYPLLHEQNTEAEKYAAKMLDILVNKDDIKKIFLISAQYWRISEENAHVEREIQAINYIAKIAKQHGKKVYLIEEQPQLQKRVVDNALRRFHSQQKDVATKRRVAEKDKGLLMDKLVSGLSDVQIVRTLDAWCPPDKEMCLSFSAEGKPLYRDFLHLTKTGSRFLAEHILKPYLTDEKKESK